VLYDTPNAESCDDAMRDVNDPATIHAETSDWLIDARTSQRPDAAGAPIDM
jgi:hypothetical protein